MEMGVVEHLPVEGKVEGLGSADIDDATLAVDDLVLHFGVVDKGAVFVHPYHGYEPQQRQGFDGADLDEAVVVF